MSGGLLTFAEKLRAAGELAEIRIPVDPVLEITEITDRISKLPGGGKALLFHDTGTRFPVLINALGSERRMSMALCADSLDEAGERVNRMLNMVTGMMARSSFSRLIALPEILRMASWMPRKKKGRGACQKHVMEKPDLSALPVLKCWPYDGGRFITLPVVHTVHPDTGLRNAGMYRMQVFSADTTGMHWHRHKTGAQHYCAYKEKKERMPVAVILGGDPLYAYAASAPLPDGIDEYLLAGFLRKRRVTMVRCLTQDIWVPEDADIVIEGFVDPSEPSVTEGPFGDHTGFYSLQDLYPLFHVTCITYRQDAVYPATIVGIPPQEDYYIAKATERIFLPPIRFTLLPEITDLSLPAFGVAHNLAIVSVKKSYPGQASKIAGALWGAGQMMFNKFLVVVDENVNVHDLQQVFHALLSHVRIPDDLIRQTGPLDVLDHAGIGEAYGGKLLLDATEKFREELTAVSPAREFSELSENAGNAGAHVTIVHTIKAVRMIITVAAIAKPQCSFREAVAWINGRIHKPDGKTHIIIITDQGTENLPADLLLWYILANTDPVRDIVFYRGTVPVLGIDATRKSKKTDKFERKWPNVLIMSDEIIQRVDERWSFYDIGSFIPSPSLKVRSLGAGYGPEVVSEE